MKIISLENLSEPIKVDPKETKEVHIRKGFVDIIMIEK